jgi:C1A family cysteine protease
MPKNHQSQIVDTSSDAGLAKKFNPGQTVNTTDRVTQSISNYRLNWRPDRPDFRDYIFTGVPDITPAKVDLREFCSKIEDQGAIGSCTGCAISSAMELILKRERRLLDLSRLFIYYQERLLEGSVLRDAGAYLRTGIKSCYTWGAPDERLWRYDPKLLFTRPSPAAYEDALKRRVAEYRRCPDFTTVKNALASGNPVVVGFLVYTSFLSLVVAKTGVMPFPNVRKERILGGHAVCLVGYDDTRRVFIAKNSWGTNWGDGGYFYMPYQVIENRQMSADFWVITKIS